MYETDGFGEFVAIVKAGSVSGAARSLEVPRATLSRRLSRLESRLGVRLVHRTTRHLSLTLAGQELFRRAARIQREAQEAEAAVRQLDDVPRGVLRVSVPPTGGTAFSVVFTSFLAKYPEVELQVSANLRHVDLAREGFDVALRAGVVRDPALISRRVISSRRFVIGTCETFATLGRPHTVDELARFDCVCTYDPVTGLPDSEWPLLDGSNIRVSGRLATNDLDMTLTAVRDLQALALVPIRIARMRLGSDAFETVLEHEVGGPADISVVYLDRAYLDPKVRAFVDHVVIEVPARFEGGDDAVDRPDLDARLL